MTEISRDSALPTPSPAAEQSESYAPTIEVAALANPTRIRV